MTSLSIPDTELEFWIAAAVLTAIVTALLVRTIVPLDGPSRRLGLAIVTIVPIASLSLYVSLGRPALTAWHTQAVLPPFITSAVEKLTADTARHPDDAEAWLLLGDVNRKAQRFADAEAAYRHALALDPADASLKISVAETMLAQNGGRVTSAILALLAASPKDPIARYYHATATAQAADWAGALAEWQTLRSDLPAGSPMRPAVEARIQQAQRVTGAVEDR